MIVSVPQQAIEIRTPASSRLPACLLQLLLIFGGASAAEFTGSTSCKICHEQPYKQWQQSHHFAAMQPAGPDTVLGDFSGQSFNHFGDLTRFERDGDTYLVFAKNEAGMEQRFEVTHTFGVYPLQQYLLETTRGRKQALTVAWDSRTSAEGGQRWYHLYPEEATPPGDELHWNSPLFNWNGMCAECHSTNLKMGYAAETDSFATTFSEISVGCEACHGPGSEHIAQARRGQFEPSYGLAVDLDDQAGASWVIDAVSGMAQRSTPVTGRQQTESCGRCHARRGVLTEDYRHGKHLTDTHLPSLLEEGLYFADGRILDEVYVYGSFKQSAMYAAGVTCSNCHNPHSGQLKSGNDNPSGVCSQCHIPSVFAAADHAPDPNISPDQCVDCHMPARTYMGVDPRRDHSFRIPDAGDRPGHYGKALAAGRAGPANPALAAAVENTHYPNIARATALSLLRPPFSSQQRQVVFDSLKSSSPLLRIAALGVLNYMAPESRGGTGVGLLRDPNLAVRVTAARTFAGNQQLVSAAARDAFEKAAAETRQGLRASLWQPLNAMNLADFESRTGRAEEAEQAFLHALRLAPKMALAHHAYGLFLVRQGRGREALPALQAAVNYAPDDPRLTYVLGVALNSLGQPQEALRLLGRAFERWPQDLEIGWALATMLRDSGDRAAARHYAQVLAQTYPANPNVQALLRSLSVR
ncbi:MAG: tetratricopeptide repeat protein [Pseudomonadota bacterium]